MPDKGKKHCLFAFFLLCCGDYCKPLLNFRAFVRNGVLSTQNAYRRLLAQPIAYRADWDVISAKEQLASLCSCFPG